MKTQMPESGKVSPDIFNEIILPHLGRKRNEVIVGPHNGVDVGVVSLQDGRVMVTTTDPVFVVPAYGWERSGWFAVNVLASDAVTSGLPPQYITIDLNLPLSLDRDEFEVFWDVVHRECDRIGMAIISGHTGRYQGCDYPMLGGATVISIGLEKDYLTPCMARQGDAVLVTKGAAIEAAGIFAVTFPERIKAAYGPEFSRQASELFWQMSVVKDALTAVSIGRHDQGITSMHDATECGVLGGLYEIARASGVGMRIEKEKILVQDPVRKICELFDIDPYISISEGTLLITCRPHKVSDLIKALNREQIPVSQVGTVLDRKEGIVLQSGGQKEELIHPQVDPFWVAFEKAVARG